MKGEDVKKALRAKRRFQWELAREIGVHEVTLVKWLRGDVEERFQQRILDGLNKMGITLQP